VPGAAAPVKHYSFGLSAIFFFHDAW